MATAILVAYVAKCCFFTSGQPRIGCSYTREHASSCVAVPSPKPRTLEYKALDVRRWLFGLASYTNGPYTVFEILHAFDLSLTKSLLHPLTVTYNLLLVLLPPRLCSYSRLFHKVCCTYRQIKTCVFSTPYCLAVDVHLIAHAYGFLRALHPRIWRDLVGGRYPHNC